MNRPTGQTVNKIDGCRWCRRTESFKRQIKQDARRPPPTICPSGTRQKLTLTGYQMRTWKALSQVFSSRHKYPPVTWIYDNINAAGESVTSPGHTVSESAAWRQTRVRWQGGWWGGERRRRLSKFRQFKWWKRKLHVKYSLFRGRLFSKPWGKCDSRFAMGDEWSENSWTFFYKKNEPNMM